MKFSLLEAGGGDILLQTRAPNPLLKYGGYHNAENPLPFQPFQSPQFQRYQNT